MEYKSPLDMLYEWESTHPNKVYLHQPVNNVWKTCTWKEAADEARRMAAALLAMNFPPGSNIAMVSKNCAHWILCDLAIMMSGHISVPLYPNLMAGTIKQILEHSGAVLLFVGKLDDWPSMKAGVPEGLNCISFPINRHDEYENWDDIIQKFSPLTDHVKRTEDEIATIIYTSGTTGTPKGVVHTYGNFSFTILHASRYLGVSRYNRFFSYLPLSHIAERVLVEMGSIYNLSEIFFAESLEKFPGNLVYAQPTIFFAVPRIWKKFQEGILQKMPQHKLDILLKIPVVSTIVKQKIRKGLGLAKAKNIFTGASATPVELLKWFDTVGIKIQEAYAMTENCCYSHVMQNHKVRIGFVGQALPECEVRLDNNREILIRHKALMTGYYKEPVATSETFTTEGFLRTGDEGSIDEQGFLQITGRVKDIFKTSKGKYIAPLHIEMKISALSELEFVCVAGMGLPQPIALITLSESGRKKSREDLQSTLEKTLRNINHTLEAFEHVAKMIILKDQWTIENHLITPSFKIKRNKIEEKYMASFESWYGEKEMLIWEE